MEEIAARINSGDVEGVMSLGLEPTVLEQAQIVAELFATDELNMNKQGDTEGNMCSSADSSLEIEEVKQTGSPPKKKLKLSSPAAREEAKMTSINTEAELTVADKIEAAGPFFYFLSTITSVPETENQPLSISFSDLLDPSLGVLQESVQFNFMVELGWLLAQYCRHKVQ